MALMLWALRVMDLLPTENFSAYMTDPTTKPSMIYKVDNPYTDEKRPFYFISDPPHLMKTVRNCWASKYRHMWVGKNYPLTLINIMVFIYSLIKTYLGAI